MPVVEWNFYALKYLIEQSLFEPIGQSLALKCQKWYKGFSLENVIQALIILPKRRRKYSVSIWIHSIWGTLLCECHRRGISKAEKISKSCMCKSSICNQLIEPVFVKKSLMNTTWVNMVSKHFSLSKKHAKRYTVYHILN